MSTKQPQVNNYVEAINTLRNYIKANYSESGWLPAGRQMAQDLNISYSTYRKALSFLSEERIVKGFPQKSHYVFAKSYWPKKLGLVFRSGERSPYFTDKRVVHGIMESLDNSDYDLHILQGVSTESIAETATSFDVKGIIWLFPPQNMLDDLHQIEIKTNIPIVAVDYTTISTEKLHHVTVTYDTEKSVKERFQKIIDNEHENILYIGEYKFACKYQIPKLLANAGIEFGPEHCIENIWNNQKILLKLIKQNKITGIVAEGGKTKTKCLFETLLKLPEKLRPDVVIAAFPELQRLHQLYPDIKLLKRDEQKVNLGEAAIEMIINHLENGADLKTVKFFDKEKTELKIKKTLLTDCA